MLHIYTDTHLEEIDIALQSVEGLSQAVKIKSLAEIDEHVAHVIIVDGQLNVSIPWSNEEPPILFHSLDFRIEDFQSLCLCKLGYEEEALQFAQDVALKETIKHRLQLKDPERQLHLNASGDGYMALHNQAIINHYVGHFHNGSTPDVRYASAIEKAPSEEHKAFTARHLAIWLTDQGNHVAAERVLKESQEIACSDQAKYHLALDLIPILMYSISHQTDSDQSKDLKKLIWESLKYFEDKQVTWAVASLYAQAADIAMAEQSYSEALGYLTKALNIYQEEGYPEFIASAFMQKGTLLFTWAQDENPQFYQSAIDAYQEALKVFTRDNNAHAYAEIHHNLAVIYAEMPADDKKKAMWAAFSATSFKECLEFFNKETFPYQYAMVANNYGNALLKYPPAKTGDNIEKAVHYHLEALDIRTADQFPIERAHAILNYLEACWRAHNINKTMERARYKDMIAMAKEVKMLTDQPELMEQAQAHLDQLNALTLSILND